MLGDFVARLAHGFAAERDEFVGAVELEQADLADLQADQHVGRVAGETRAHDAVLGDVEGVDHHRGEARRARRLARPLPAQQPAPRRRRVGRRRFVGSSAGSASTPRRSGMSWIAVPRPVPSMAMLSAMTRSAPSARATLTGTGLTIAPSNSQRRPSAPVRTRRAGRRRRASPRQRAALQPDFMPGAEFGRDAGEADRQVLDAHGADRLLEPPAQPIAADQPAAAEGKVEQAEHAPLGQRAGEDFRARRAGRRRSSRRPPRRSRIRRRRRERRPSPRVLAARRYAPSRAPRRRRAPRRSAAASGLRPPETRSRLRVLRKKSASHGHASPSGSDVLPGRR